MRKHSESPSLKIPDSFTIAGGKKIIINVIEKSSEFGLFDPILNTISIAKNVKNDDDGEYYSQTEEDMFRTYLHELVHSFQFYFNCGSDEAQAQVYSNFLYEWYISQSQNGNTDM